MSSAPLTPSSVPNDVGQSLHDSCHSTFWYVSGPHGTHTLFGISVNVPGGHFTAKTKFRCTYVVLSSSLRVCADQELAWHMQLEFNCDVMSGHDVCACLRLSASLVRCVRVHAAAARSAIQVIKTCGRMLTSSYATVTSYIHNYHNSHQCLDHACTCSYTRAV